MFGGVLGVPGWGVVAAALNSSEKESRQKLDRAVLEKEQADILVEKIKAESLTRKATIYTVKKCTQVLTDLNKMFVTAQINASKIITNNGMDKSKYNFEERKQLAVWINLAKAIKDLIDLPILGEDGLVSTIMIETLDINEKVIGEQN